VVGLLALAANDLRLILTDLGTMLASAAFVAALAIGFVALLADERFNIPRMAMTVAPIVIRGASPASLRRGMHRTHFSILVVTRRM